MGVFNLVHMAIAALCVATVVNRQSIAAAARGIQVRLLGRVLFDGSLYIIQTLTAVPEWSCAEAASSRVKFLQ